MFSIGKNEAHDVQKAVIEKDRENVKVIVDVEKEDQISNSGGKL